MQTHRSPPLRHTAVTAVKRHVGDDFHQSVHTAVSPVLVGEIRSDPILSDRPKNVSFHTTTTCTRRTDVHQSAAIPGQIEWCTHVFYVHTRMQYRLYV